MMGFASASTLAALNMSRFAKFNHQRCICQTNAVDTHRKIKICRPTLDDVQRLSQGQRAKTRGWGSRQVCHRLNEMERKAFDVAKDRGYLTIRGTGYRKERKGSPLANIYRQLCDAEAQHCVVVENLPGGQMDCVLIDLSTLRCAHDPITRQKHGEKILEIADNVSKSHGDCSKLSVREVMSPFTVIIPPFIVEGDKQDEEVLQHYLQSPMWQIPPDIVAYSCSRPIAKELAKQISLVDLQTIE